MSKKINSFEDLEIWQLAHSIVLKIYKTTKSFPKEEEYRLTPQIIRSISSVPANIAEGMGRYSKKEFLQYLIIARGSVEESKYYIILAKDLQYITNDIFLELKNDLTILGRKINSLIKAIKTKDEKTK